MTHLQRRQLYWRVQESQWGRSGRVRERETCSVWRNQVSETSSKLNIRNIKIQYGCLPGGRIGCLSMLPFSHHHQVITFFLTSSSSSPSSLLTLSCKTSSSPPSSSWSSSSTFFRGDSSDSLNDGGGFEDEVGRILWQVRRKYKNTQWGQLQGIQLNRVMIDRDNSDQFSYENVQDITINLIMWIESYQ